MDEQIDKFVDLIFDFNMKDLEDETKLLENYKKLQQENKQLKEELKAVNKGLRKVLSKRKKWKYRYYKEKIKNRKALKYIEDKIQKSFNADWGLENSRRSDRLLTETVIELQIIEQILKGGCENGDN